VIHATQSGKPIFCEEPLSTSIEGTHQMLRALEASGVMFQAAFQRQL